MTHHRQRLHAPSPTASSTHLHHAGFPSTTSTEYAPQHWAASTSPWSSSPTTIYTNISVSSPPPSIVVNVNAKWVLLHRIRVKSPTSNNSITRSTSTNVIFVHHDLTTRVGISFFLYSETNDGNRPSNGESSLLLQPTLTRMVCDGPCLCMTGLDNTGSCIHPRHSTEFGKLGTACRLPRLPQLCLIQQ